jgi:RimJ/RimL family protein N-acetyltransferase
MIQVDKQLFAGNKVCLGPIDYERDPEVESSWTHDPDYMRLTYLEPALPRSIAQVKKRYEGFEKEQEEHNNFFYFTIRMRQDDRLIGFAKIYWVEWTNGSALIQLAIGNPQDRQKGYGSEAISMLLGYAFDELNLFRLTAWVPEYNQGALRLFEKAGFTREVQRRQAVNRDGRRWDLIHLGILREEWVQNKVEEK